MSNYDSSKPNPTAQYPSLAAKDTAAGFTRVEPWITPEVLKEDFLFGIPLVSPTTNQQISDESLKRIIRRAAAKLELDCEIDVHPVQRFQRIEFDRTKYLQGWNEMQLDKGNVRSVEEVTIRAANSTVINGATMNYPQDPEGTVIFKMPLEWIDTSFFAKGLIHVIPLQTTFNSYAVTGAGNYHASPLYAVLSQLNYTPAYFAVRYTCGFDENSVPSIINRAMALMATKEVLGMLGPTIRFNSQSISIDGTSQSTSGPGSQLFVTRMQQIDQELAEIIPLIKARFTRGIYMTNF